MFSKHRLGLTLVALTALGFAALPSNAQSVITNTPFTGDSDSGISTSNSYNLAVDLNGTGETINGVTFSGGGPTGTGTGGVSYSLNVPSRGSFTNYNNVLTGSIHNLATDFYYSGLGGTGATETLTISGLTAGTKYNTTFYNVAFGGVGTRKQNFSDSLGGSLPGYDENGSPASLLSDTYTTVATGVGSTSVVFTFVPTTSNSEHQYGFSNSIVASPEPSQFAALGFTALGLLALTLKARRRSGSLGL